jgi:hypothetical protein
MRTRLLIPAALICLAVSCFAQEPDIQGYVTRVAPPEFDVNGTHVLLTASTYILMRSNKESLILSAKDLHLYLGQIVKVFGNHHHKQHSITADRIEFEATQALREVSGHGIVDAVMDASSPGEHLLRADGYPVLISANTVTTFDPPLSASAFRTNVWLTFRGHQRPDGVVVADKAGFVANVVNRSEGKLRDKAEYDPESVAPGTEQTTASRLFRGVDPKQIPPYIDDAMQTRIDQIGAKLVPQYQRDLPPDDETRIEFRFQLIDEKGLHCNTGAEPSGIILVSHQAAERMQNDSQLAALLAADIAVALEKQTFRTRPTARKIAAANVAAHVGGIFVPGLGLASTLATGVATATMMQHVMEQSGRVSLCLMHDAGFDQTQAPLAWWLLADKKSKGLENTAIPASSQYLYKFLGETWRGK